MTRGLANALKHDRIRINTLNIGWTNTPREHIVQTKVHSRPENWLKEVSRNQPFGRLIEADEVARALAFLTSAESGLLTGAVIDFDQTVIGAADDNPGRHPIPRRRAPLSEKAVKMTDDALGRLPRRALKFSTNPAASWVCSGF
jgi:Enoyl-(Acyl carrier protein) reductase